MGAFRSKETSSRDHVSAHSPGSDDEGEDRKVNLSDFDIMSTIGEGNYATVVLAKKKDTGRFCAIKILKKEVLLKRDEVEHTMTERSILGKLRHPFLVRMHYAFQTQEKLYLVMQFINGGELFLHLKKSKRFTEERSRFYAAEICSGLEYLHGQGIVYRDLKPENVLIDAEGHIVLTDFGLSKILKHTDKTKTFCGTPEYLAPEILLNRGHGKPVDWWSFGTLLYEMLVGIPPFYSTDVHEMYNMILHSDLYIPEFVSPSARDILTKLLERDPKRRLGTRSSDEVKSHSFFSGIDWIALFGKKIAPPFKPPVSCASDIGLVDSEFTTKPIPDHMRNDVAKVGSKDINAFEGFTFEANTMAQLRQKGTSMLTSSAAQTPQVASAESPPEGKVPHALGSNGDRADIPSSPPEGDYMEE